MNQAINKPQEFAAIVGYSVQKLDPLADPEWDLLVNSHPGVTIFHTSAWARVLSRTYNHMPCYLAIRSDGKLNALVALMEVDSFITGLRGVSLPFSDLCEPLFFGQSPFSSLHPILMNLGQQRHWRHFEIRGGDCPARGAEPSVSFFAHRLNLRKNLDEIYAGFASPVRRALKKACRAGVTVEIRADFQAMQSFYRLHVITRKRHGVPPQPFSFFVAIWEELLRNGKGFVVLGFHQGIAIAAAVFFHHEKAALYKFGASDEGYQELRANNLVMWEGIRTLVGRGCHSLHFGRTSCNQPGLQRFKLGWGAEEGKLDYFKYSCKSRKWVTGKDRVSGIHAGVFSRFPSALNRLIGRLVYPHLD